MGNNSRQLPLMITRCNNCYSVPQITTDAVKYSTSAPWIVRSRRVIQVLDGGTGGYFVNATKDLHYT